MSSGPVVVAVLSKVDAVGAWRELIGPADPNVARDTSPASRGSGEGELVTFARASTLLLGSTPPSRLDKLLPRGDK